MKNLIKLVAASSVIMAGSVHAAVFNCASIVTDVTYNYGTYRIHSTNPSGVHNQSFAIPSHREYLIGQALQAQSTGNVYTIVVEHTPQDPSGDTRCRDNNEALQAVAITQ